MKLPKGWKCETVGDLCDFSNGHGFGPHNWSKVGLPIIRIQNLNGEADFNYFNGRADADWLVEPGTLLFAWAGTRGVSFGPKIWNGPTGVLNQHIYRVHPRQGINKNWLYLALREVTERIERKAHGFKATLLHVGKKDIIRQVIDVPPLPEQRKIAEVLGAWDDGLENLDALIVAKERRKKGLLQRLLTGKRRVKGFVSKWNIIKASALFETRCERNVDNLAALSVTQDIGVLLRNDLDRRIQSDAKNLCTYKVVRKGDFIISLRSFEGGLEYAALSGAVSPAYHVIRPIVEIEHAYYKHYFKSPDFIGRLAIAVIGIRDGRQVSVDDFMLLKLPCPSVAEQRAIAEILDACDEELRLLRARRAAVGKQKRGLMQRLLTGATRVRTENYG